MKRHVFIIKGYSKTHQELELDRFYIKKYYDYFSSISGGAFEDKEITHFQDITTSDLNNAIADLEFDYVIILLIGHGATQNNNQLFQLNYSEIIRAGQLNIKADKQLFLFESCRTQIDIIDTVDLNDEIPKFQSGGVLMMPIERRKARELFEEQLKKCGDGVVVCFACSSKEVAKNYYFSSVLIRTAFNWHLQPLHHFETFNIVDLMNTVSKEVNELATRITGESQQPQIIGNLNFPFSVSKF